jgi:hypothetical protein
MKQDWKVGSVPGPGSVPGLCLVQIVLLCFVVFLYRVEFKSLGL